MGVALCLATAPSNPPTPGGYLKIFLLSISNYLDKPNNTLQLWGV